MLKFLGVGSCFNTDMGNTSAYYIEGDNLTLFDCGEMTFEAIKKRDLLKDINSVNIFITHLHSDHVGSLPSFIFYLNFLKGIKPTIWFPNNDIIKWLRLGNVPDKLYNYMLAIDSEEFLYVVKQKHTIAQSAYGYVMKIQDKWIYYSGDANTFALSCKQIDNGILWKDKNIVISHIYHEVTMYINDAHVNIFELVEMFPRFMRENITLMHFDDEETVKIAKEIGFKVATIEE